MSLRFLEKEAVENARTKSVRLGHDPRPKTGWNVEAARKTRLLGRSVLDVQMLLFVQGRYEFRMAGILSYAPAAQSLVVSGMEKQILIDAAQARMGCARGALQALSNSFRIMKIYSRLNYSILRLFYTYVVQRIAARSWPATTRLFLEILFDRTALGLPLGLRADTRHPFAEPGESATNSAPTKAERVEKKRCETWRLVENALERLLNWVRREEHLFRHRVAHWDAESAAVLEVPASLRQAPSAGGSLSPPAEEAAKDMAIDPEADEDSDRPCDLDNKDTQKEAARGRGSQKAAASSRSSSSSSSSSSSCDVADAAATATPPVLPDACGPIESMLGDRTEGDLVLWCRGGALRRSSYRCLRIQRWVDAMQGRLAWGTVGVRKVVLMCATTVFHAVPLLATEPSEPDDGSLSTRRVCLRRLYDHFGQLLWGQSRESCPFEDPPPEMFETPSFEDLWNQYLEFKHLARTVAERSDASPDVYSVYETVSARIARRGREQTVPISSLDLSKTRSTYGGLSPEEYVYSRVYGEEVLVLLWVRVPRDHTLHAALLSLRYSAVVGHRVWHILRLYHRAFMFAEDSEAIAETVGSHMRYIEKRQSCGRPLATRNLVRAVRLRAFGLRGDMRDVSIIRQALVHHFRNSSPDALRFQIVHSRTRAAREGVLGPSLPVARIRERILLRSSNNFVFSWLLRCGPARELCKKLGKEGVDAVVEALPPSDLPDEVWQATLCHLLAVNGPEILGYSLPRLK